MHHIQHSHHCKNHHLRLIKLHQQTLGTVLTRSLTSDMLKVPGVKQIPVPYQSFTCTCDSG